MDALKISPNMAKRVMKSVLPRMRQKVMPGRMEFSRSHTSI